MIVIDNITSYSGNYTQGELIIFSIDNYEVGAHTITIWAIGLDEKEAEIETAFTVLPKTSKPVLSLSSSPSVTAIILSVILIFVPGTVFGVSHHYRQKFPALTTSKRHKISTRELISKGFQSK